MNIWQKWTSISLVLRIFIGLIIGAILGFLVPSQEWISIFGDMFVGALKGIAPVLVFVLVASSLANAKGGNADRFKVVIFLYMLSTLIAANCRCKTNGIGTQNRPGTELRGIIFSADMILL